MTVVAVVPDPARTPVEILRRAAAQIRSQPRLSKGAYVREVSHQLCFCIAGALDYVAGARVLRKNGELKLVISRLCLAVPDAARYVNQALDLNEGSLGMVLYNDAKGRTKREIVALLERAVVLAEADAV